ncbi:saccharopine dehydrogenase NADP-binding domain-containing protein [Aliivibrio finisterrensis]|uniref:Saccharopine dehydrogenase NADP binding domain-containing protein n=1 Tax=Aliivibrio finisterrensis TaxID=511998 RepID=A0A6N6RSB9_9GAMM|nr:saccharopine dehydrogenase NADP-binding domain-containing protein [Aliivibrio finisterrensis]KAB2824516.1 hypothetical protein F8B77_10405 [Aliivibrio finisterrensis]
MGAGGVGWVIAHKAAQNNDTLGNITIASRKIEKGQHHYVIASCLASVQFCERQFDQPLAIGQKLHLADSAGYTMVKLNWFNGLKMPSVYCELTTEKIEKLNEFGYTDFKRSLSQWAVSS